MNRTIRNLLCASAALAPLAIGAPAAMAADQPSAAGLDTVVVTAQKRSENIQVVPIAITAATGKQLTQTGVTSIDGLSTIVSGFAGPGVNSMASPHIRGVGSQVPSPGIENSVALYVDGIYIGDNSPALLNLNDMDIAQVEVLKGPQGTLFGRNTTGGLIQINTRNPGPTPEADLEFTAANYSTYTGAAYFNLPINQNISTNLAIQASTQGQGYGTNLTTGLPVYKDNLDLTIRNKWNIRLDENDQVQIIADYEHRNDQGLLAQRPVTGSYPLGSTLVAYPGLITNPAAPYTPVPSTVGGWNVTENGDERDVNDAFGLAGRFSHDFGFATLSDTVAYRSTIFDQLNFDLDETAFPSGSVFWHAQDHQWTDELQLASKGNDRLQWTTGFFYYNGTDYNYNEVLFGYPGTGPISCSLTAPPPAPGPSCNNLFAKLNTTSYSGYAQASYKIFTNTTLTGGIRYAYDQHSIIGSQTIPLNYPFSPPVYSGSAAFAHQSLVYRVSLAQQITEDAMAYFSFNHGDKSGGFNPSVIGNGYQDELLDTYEVGAKLTSSDKRVRLNMAAFYYNYTNIQVDFFPPGAPPVIYNGPSATLYGFDADLEVRPTSNLTINGNLEVLHSGYGNFMATGDKQCTAYVPSPFGGAPICYGAGFGYYASPVQAKGHPLPYAPDFTASISADYTIPTRYGKWDLSGVYSYNGGYYGTPGLEIHQPAYSLLSASVQFTAPDDRYYVRVWGKNLTNSQYSSDLDITADSTSMGLNPPTTFGVTLGAKFK